MAKRKDAWRFGQMSNPGKWRNGQTRGELSPGKLRNPCWFKSNLSHQQGTMFMLCFWSKECPVFPECRKQQIGEHHAAEQQRVLSRFRDGDIAQLGEHLLCTQRVAGSSPTISTNRQATCRVTLEDWSNKVKQSLQDVFRYQNTTGTEQKCLGSVTPCGIRGRR